MNSKTEQSEELMEFKVEAFEMLENAESDLLGVDKGKEFQTVYGSVFRIFHSLKGAAGMFELADLQSHMHSLENILSGCQARNTFSQSEVTFFLKGVDAARKILSGEKVQFDYNPSEENIAVPSLKSGPHSENKTKSTETSLGLAYVIDDEPEILEILKSMLISALIDVKTFTDPEEALVAIKTFPPQLVISDMKMPQLSGLEVLKAVKILNPDIPVIFISGHLNKLILLESLREGAFTAIEKPFKENNVIATCLTAIKHSRLSLLLNRSINLIMYQFTDLEDFLLSHGKNEIAQTMRKELELLIEQRKQFRQLKKESRKGK